MEKVKITIYNFKELDENTQNKIINNYIDFLINTTDFTKLHKNTNLYKAFKDCKRMQTPWFINQYIWNYCKNQILKECKKYNYFKNGEIYI